MRPAMPDTLTQPDACKAALATLAKAGAHFVLCGADKRPKAKAWQKTRPPLDAAHRHDGPVGVIPASLGCVVVDVDVGGDQACKAVISQLGTPLAKVPTRRTCGWHLWFKCRDAKEIGNRAWRDGDIRGAKGYAILWRPELVAKGLACTAPVADLMAVDLDKLPLKRRGAAEGERNNALNKSVFLATRNGAPIDGHVDAARQAGLPEGEIAETVESAVSAGKRQGARTFVANARTPPALRVCLDGLGIGLRLNTRAKRYEYRIGGKWHVADDERDAWLRHEIAEKFSTKSGSNAAMPLKYSAEVFLDLRRALGDGLRRDPFRDWLEALPPWDGVPRIDGLLTDLFGAEDDPLTRWASRYIGIGALQRAFEPGCKIDEVPVLLGAQGVGKSAFARNWFSEDQHEWHGDAVDLGARPKEQAEQLAGKVVVELSEMTGIRKAELERLKSFITRQDDGQFRWAYARAPVPSPRMCAFIGTTNEAECLPNDPSGNRRFVVVALERGCDVEAASVDRAQWWCEALARYRAGERANLPRELHAKAEARAEEHRETDSAEQDIADALHDLGAEFTVNDLHDALRAGDAQEWSKPLDRALQMRLGTALRNLGFKKAQRSRDGTRQMVWSRA